MSGIQCCDGGGGIGWVEEESVEKLEGAGMQWACDWGKIISDLMN